MEINDYIDYITINDKGFYNVSDIEKIQNNLRGNKPNIYEKDYWFL